MMRESERRGSRRRVGQPAGSTQRVSAGAIPYSMRRRAAAIAGVGAPFLAVLYLGLEGGGYDIAIFGEVGVLAWWFVLLGAAFGLLPTVRPARAGLVLVAILLALAAWTGLAMLWTDSQERTAIELARLASLLGITVLATLAQGRESLRRTIAGVAAAIAVIAIVALASRLEPGLISTAEPSLLPAANWRLSHPLGYWNGLAALIAIGLPLVLWCATHARTPAWQALAAAAAPAMVLAAFFTFSRGGVAEIALALAVLAVLHPRRLELAAMIAPATAGSAILIAAATQRDALQDEPFTAAGVAEGGELFAIVLVVCAGVALIQFALGLVRSHRLLPGIRVPRRAALVATAAGIVVALAAALAADLPGYADDRWQEFKAGGGTGSGTDRFPSASGNGRYQYWTAAVDASRTEPMLGIGPGTYEYWWAQTGTVPGFVRDAHSLYLEMLGELGVPGLLLVLGLVGWPLGAIAVRSMQRGSVERRSLLAAAAAACVAFAVAAQLDWVWELTVVPVAFLLVAAAALGPSALSRRRASSSRFQRPMHSGWTRTAMGVAAGAALVAIALPLESNTRLLESQAAVRTGALGPALEHARSAQRLQPHAATPYLQQALVLELMGSDREALRAAREATEREEVNWRVWVVRSRLAAKAGRIEESLDAYGKARELYPRGRF